MRKYKLVKKQFQSTPPSWDSSYAQVLKYFQYAEKYDGKNEYYNNVFIREWEDYKENYNLVRPHSV